MIVVWKYPLQHAERQTVEMPMGSVILTVQYQRDTLCLWAVVDPDMSTVERHLVLVGTGQEIPPADLIWIASVQHPTQPFVWHLFEDHARRPDPPDAEDTPWCRSAA